ncbi:RloB family protein [Isoalcanivorax beigongshangi]|uniref:RloB family protein n=1 Tax=Isoalcanivorax beigongshangi TaxID=3238810 RepID=A0ABV4AIJ5_9GAMM
MANANHRSRRKGRNAAQLSRKKSVKNPYERVLIVTEGSKTEPYYFRELRNHFRLSSANIEITGKSDPTPDCIIKYAKTAFARERSAGNPFDKVFCVFDRDSHAVYDAVVAEISTMRPRGVFSAVLSVPSFEYWLRLHFSYTAAPYAAAGRRSAGDMVVADLKRHIPAYEKALEGVFQLLLTRLDTALLNAERRSTEVEHEKSDNPSTQVHILVRYLMSFKENP